MVDLVSYDAIVNNYRVFLGPLHKENFNSDIVDNPEKRTTFLSGQLSDGGKFHVKNTQEFGYVLVEMDYM